MLVINVTSLSSVKLKHESWAKQYLENRVKLRRRTKIEVPATFHDAARGTLNRAKANETSRKAALFLVEVTYKNSSFCFSSLFLKFWKTGHVSECQRIFFAPCCIFDLPFQICKKNRSAYQSCNWGRIELANISTYAIKLPVWFYFHEVGCILSGDIIIDYWQVFLLKWTKLRSCFVRAK